MVRLTVARALALATAVSAVVAATPASATRQIIYDSTPVSISVCSVGQDCGGNANTSFDGVPDLPFTTLYVYQQGVISFDSPLLSNSVDGLGSSTYFAPAYSPQADYSVSAIQTLNDNGRIGLVLDFSTDSEQPLFQATLIPEDDDSFSDVHYYYNPDGSSPPDGAFIGYSAAGSSNSATSTNLDLGASDFSVTLHRDDDGDLDSASDVFTIVPLAPAPSAPVTAAPEPATWVLMMLGLGAAGAAMRRHPRRTLAPA